MSGLLAAAWLVVGPGRLTAQPPDLAHPDAAPPAGARAGPRGVVAGRLVDRAGGAPLGGVRVSLAGTARETRTDADGRFVIDGLVNGYFRPLVPGACAAPLERLPVLAGDTTRATIPVAMSCSPPRRWTQGADGALPGVRSRLMRAAAIVVGGESAGAATGEPVAAAPGPGRALVFLEPLAPGAARHVRIELLEDAARQAPGPAPSAGERRSASGALAGGLDWIGVIEPDRCFASPTQVVLRRDGVALVRLGCLPGGGGPCEALERRLCLTCVEAFFREIEAARLWEQSGVFEQRAGTSAAGETLPVILAGSVGDHPFLIWTRGVHLYPAGGFRTQLLDMLAYFPCVGDADMPRVPVRIELRAPAVVSPGRVFSVAAQATADTTLDAGVLRLEVAGATWVGGDRARTGAIGPGEPLALEALFRLPAGGASAEIEAVARFLLEGGRAVEPVRRRTLRARIAP